MPRMKTEQIVEPPDWLTGTAADVWRQHAWRFFSDGYLTEASRDLYGCFCQVAALQQEVVGWVVSREAPVFIAPDGLPCAWPEIELLTPVEATKEALGVMLGMPREEARLSLLPRAEAKSR